MLLNKVSKGDRRHNQPHQPWAIGLHCKRPTLGHRVESVPRVIGSVQPYGQPEQSHNPKTNTERGHIFDYGGHHPNIKLCGGKTQRRNQLQYLEKDGFWKSNEEEVTEDEVPGVQKDDVYRRALEGTTYKEFTDIIMEGMSFVSIT